MTIQVRRDTAATWTSNNPTMSEGQWGYETDTGKMKIGDGSTAWNDLSYFIATYSKSLAVESPDSGDRLALFQTREVATALGVSFASEGGTSVAFNIEFATTIASGTIVHTDTCATSTPEWNVPPSGTVAIPASRIVLLEVGTVTGTVNQLTVTVYFA